MANYGNIRLAFTSALKVFELDFQDVEQYQDYKSQHEIRPTTLVRVGKKTIAAGELDKKIAKAKESGDDKAAKARGRVTDKLDKKFTELQGQIAFENDDDEKTTIETLKKLIAGEDVSKEEVETFNKYIKLKDTIEGSSEVSLYMASKEPGNFKQNARLKIELGGGAPANELRKEMEDKGVELTDPTTTGADTLKIGGKDVAPNKVSEERVKFEPKVKKAEDGSINEVDMGGHIIRRQVLPTDYKDKLKANNPKMSDDEINDIYERTKVGIERNNALLEQYAEAGEIEMIDPIPGADVNTEDGRKQVVEEYPQKIAKVFEERLGDNPTKAERELMEDIKALSSIEDPKEFEAASIKVIEKMNNIDSVRKGSSDLAESMVYLTMLKKGQPVYLPASANFKVSDIVAFPDLSDLDPNDADYADKLASNMKYVVNLETQGGVSIKKDGGAASAARAKLENTMFKNKETQGKLVELVDNYEKIMGTAKRDTDHKAAEAKLDEIKAWAKDNNLWDGQELSAGKTIGNSKDWADKQVQDWISKGRLKGSDEHIAEVTKSLEMHAEQALLLAHVYNNDCRGQYFGNINMDTRKDELEVTDGINTASLMEPLLNSGYSFKEDDNGNVWPVPINVYAARMLHSKWDPDTNKYQPGSH